MTATIDRFIEASRRVRAGFCSVDQAVKNFGRVASLLGYYAPPRHCIRETFSEGPVQGCWLKVWTFHYSDGTTEQLKRIIEK